MHCHCFLSTESLYTKERDNKSCKKIEKLNYLLYKVGVNPWLIAVAYTQNAARESREIYQASKMLKEIGTLIYLLQFFYKTIGKTWKS